MIDQLKQIAIFAKTIDHGSFRGAARELQLSPSVVSHHVSQLEEHLGVALIYRSTRKLTLTREGERLLAATHQLFDVVEEELASISGSANEPSGELRVTVPSVLSHSKLTDSIARFSRSYPRIKLILDYSDERKALIDNGLDAAVRMAIGGKNSATSRILFTVRRKLVASSTFLAQKKEVALEPDSLLDWAWLTLSPAQNNGITFEHPNQGRVKIKPNAAIVSNDAQSLYHLVKGGVGIAVLPEFLLTADIESGAMQYLLPDWEIDPVTVFANWPSNAPRHGLIRLFIDALRE